MSKFFIFDTETQSVDEVCRIIRAVYEQERKNKENVPKPKEQVQRVDLTPPKQPVQVKPADESEKQLVTVDELSEILQVPVSWIYQRTRLGQSEIPHFRMGRHIRFDPEVVIEYFKARTMDEELKV